MIHLRRRIFPLLVPLPAAHIPPLFSLHRLLSTAAASRVPPEPFAVDDYLVTHCHLTRAQALKASKKLSHLKSPSNPDAVLAFLSGLGLSLPDVTRLVASDPLILCAKVEQTLARRVAELSDLGLSRAQIARLIPRSQIYFRCRSLGPNVAYWLTVFSSFDKLLEAVRVNSAILGSDLERVIKPTVAFLQQCGVILSDLSAHSYVSRVINMPCRHVREAVARVDEFGVRRNTPPFHLALMTFAVYRRKVDKNIGLFKELGWSHDDLLVAFRKAPCILGVTEERMRVCMKFLTSDVGLEIPYIARRPILLKYSLERRLFPRHRLVSVLKEKGLLKGKHAFYSVACLGEGKFIDKFVRPYEESVPGLADAYASSCAGFGMHPWDLLCENIKSEIVC